MPFVPAKKKAKNPFYVLLGIAGTVFGLTAIAYAMMAAIAQFDPARGMEMMEAEQGLLPLMHRHGVSMLVVELIVLAILTVLAIGTDSFWDRRGEVSEKPSPKQETSHESQ